VKRLLALAPLLLIAACGGSSGETATPVTAPAGAITVRTTDDFRFEPGTVTVRAGEVRLLVTDEGGSYPHNLSVPGLHVTSKTVTGTPGSTSAVVALRVERPGRYRFVCTFHDQAGMTGTLIVTP